MESEIFISVVLLVVGIAILVLIHVCIVNRAFRSSANLGPAINGERSFARSSRMSQEDIKRLPCFDYMVDQEGGNNTASPLDCAVCLENFKAGDKCRLLPKCNHSFHVHCVDSWLSKTGACPICRAAVDLLSPEILRPGSNHLVQVVEFTQV